ncbi:MAG: LysM peptidoglycan-binding domain-containing protein [Candidatus Nealsonbacteria bacterium]
MSNYLKEIKRVIKPLFVALILIILIFISSSKKDKNISLLSMDLPDNNSPQSAFADPSQKSRPELPEFLLVQENSFRATYPPFTITPKVLGAMVEGFDFEAQRAIIEYIVESGDSPWSIAAKFDISSDTLLWANNLKQNPLIKLGQKLIIPPVSGLIHHVKAGDTVGEVAKKYKAKTEDIISFNDLSNEADIFAGDILVIPDGVITVPTVSYAATWVPIGKTYFMCPIAQPCRITQGIHWYNAIDFSHGRCGETIYAAAEGKVLRVRLTNSTSQWAFGGAGNHLTILHPNGVVTMYGHISTSLVQPGDGVYQGQPIALMGGQPGTAGAGMSTGCHLHFGVSNAENPFAR